MSKKLINATHLEGYVYEHKLEKKVSSETSKHPGTEFINGTLSIATDDNMMNIVQVHFTYVTETTANGKPNATYNVLMNIIDGKIGSVMEHGKENAGKVRVDSAIGLNEFYDTNNTLVSRKRNEGGFVHVTNDLNENEAARSTFEADMVITRMTRVEADEEKNQPEKGVIKGCVFDFRGALLPIDFTILSPKGIDYLEGLDISEKNPYFTKVKGNQISKTVVRKIEEEGAFGEPSIKEVRNTQRDFNVTWVQAAPYEWDSEDTLLASELDEKMRNREIYLADIKRRQEEYQNSKGNTASSNKKEYNF